jgi:hypothetical protein
MSSKISVDDFQSEQMPSYFILSFSLSFSTHNNNFNEMSVVVYKHSLVLFSCRLINITAGMTKNYITKALLFSLQDILDDKVLPNF